MHTLYTCNIMLIIIQIHNYNENVIFYFSGFEMDFTVMAMDISYTIIDH